MQVDLLLAPAATFFAVTLLAGVVLRPREADPRSRIEGYVRSADTDQPRPSFFRRALFPAVERIGALARTVSRREKQETTRQLLERAGNPMSLNVFMALRVALAIALPLAYVALFAGGGQFGARQLALTASAAYVGSYLPKMWLDRKAKARQMAIERAMADALDLIVVSMEAGLALDAALGKVAEKTTGPLSDELQRTLREMQLGKSRRDALKQLGARTGVRDLISLLNAIIQADQLGVSMSELMRTQAAEARTKRRQRAEERAHQASAKMAVPVVLCILPSVVVVAAGPAMLTAYHQFSSGLVGG